MIKKLIFTYLPALLLLTSCTVASSGSIPFASIPAGMAYSEGKEIFFSHTEASDPDLAEKLSDMMKSPVLVVPSLASIPENLTAPVYVFQNGIKGKGPLGYQPDVFPYPPGTDGYTPIRRIAFVTWVNESDAEIFTTAQQVLDAEAAGTVKLEASNLVVNMPFMVWDGGKR